MTRSFNELGITAHEKDLYEMGIKEKEHKVYFQKSLENHRLLPWFEMTFGWGTRHSSNDLDLATTLPGEQRYRRPSSETAEKCTGIPLARSRAHAGTGYGDSVRRSR